MHIQWKFARLCSLLIAGALAPAGAAHALDITLPPETARYQPSDLPGYRLAQQNCLTCHSAQYVQYQPRSSPRAYWDATVKKMKKPFGAPFADDDIPAIVDYLVKTYGAERPAAPVAAVGAITTAAAPAPSQPLSNTPQTTVARDPQTLLNANGCLACHSVDKKIVGPAFREVAAKYAKNPDAAVQIARSVRDGSDGKWGPVPMPPFSELSDADLKELATWVLSR